MASIQTFLAQTRQKSTPITLTPDTYDACVHDISYDQRYKDEVVVITYHLSKDGKTFTFKERFVKNPRFQRTRDFFEYLYSNGIDDETSFIGCHEVLDIKWNFINSGKRELTIVNRKFIGDSAENEVSTEEGGDA